MKTTQFGKLTIEACIGGTMLLRAFSPTMGHFELPMSPDELLLFLVETGNSLALGRQEEQRKKQMDELKRETER